MDRFHQGGAACEHPRDRVCRALQGPAKANKLGYPAKATDTRHSDRKGPNVGCTAMIRTAVLRALVLTAAFAAALTPVTCLGQILGQNLAQDSGQSPDKQPAKSSPKSPPKLPAKATKKLPPELLSLLRQKKMPVNSPILVRAFSRKRRSSKSGSRTPPAVSRSSRPIRFAGGRAILGRSCRRATVRLRKGSTESRPS